MYLFSAELFHFSLGIAVGFMVCFLQEAVKQMFSDYMFMNRKWNFWKEGAKVPLFLNKEFYYFSTKPNVHF